MIKIKNDYVRASYAVDRIAKTYFIKKWYVWDLFEVHFNVIRGLGCVVNQDEINYICNIIDK